MSNYFLRACERLHGKGLTGLLPITVGYDYFNDLSFGYEYKLFDSLNPVC